MKKSFYEEVIEEIGTQTLAKFGLNIFSLNAYEAYGASVTATNNTFWAYSKYKNNLNYFGYTFEELDIGQANIQDALFNTSNKSYTTDTLNDIKVVQGMIRANKNIDNLKPKDRAKYEHIMSNYKEEVENLNFNKGKLANLATKHHTVTDMVTLDKNGKVIKTAQLKVIKNTKGLLEERYLEGNDELRMPFDDYKRHKENLEKMVKEGENSTNHEEKETAEKAKRALDMLNKNNFSNRLMCENPRATAVLTQGVTASVHILEVGASDAIVVALSTLANGVVYELKDMIDKKSYGFEDVLKRIQRLFTKVMQTFMDNFKRGASFGVIDVILGILSQIFESFFRNFKYFWKELRKKGKSIYNAIYSYIKGEIKDFQQLLSVLIKAVFSALVIGATIPAEEMLKLKLSAIFTPFVADFLAPALSIIIAAFVVVAFSKSVDIALQGLFGVFAQRDIAKMRMEEIEAIIDSKLPNLIERTEELEKLIVQTYRQRIIELDSSFLDFKISIENKDSNGIYEALSKINKIYDKELEYKDFEDIKLILQKGKGRLEW